MYVSLFIIFGLSAWLLFRKSIANFLNFKINRRLELYVVIPLTVLLLIVFSLFYIKFDRQQYYYGFDCIFCDTELPYHLKPKIDRYYTFTLNDEDDYELVGNGFKYQSTSSEIKEFLGYGYNETSILVKYADSLNNIRYLSSYETGYKSSKGNPEISFKEINEAEFKQRIENYNWFDLDKDKAGKIRFYRTLSFIGAVLSLLLLLRYLIRKRKATQ